MPKFLYVTDVHGTHSVYEKMFELGKERDIDFLVFGGDITSGVSPKAQKFFLEFYLIPRLREFRKKFRKPVFLMMGNDDYSSNERLLKKIARYKTVRLLHNRYYKMRGFNIAGYPFVNPTPFLLKDWEKEEGEIGEDLEKLSKKIDPGETVYVFHAPPHGTRLDMLHSREHKGSEAIADFIRKRQPRLTLHGHIHESPDVSGVSRQRIGKTLCLNPGSGVIVSVDLGSMKVTKVKG